MRKIIFFLLAVVTGLCHAGNLIPPSGSELLVADSGKRQLAKFDSSGKMVWKYEGVYCYDVQILKNGNILFCDEQKRKQKCSYVREITPDKKVVWEYKSPGEVYSCQRTPQGTTVIGECTTGKIVEIGRDGKVLHSIKLTYKRGGHAAMRMVRKTSKATYLVAHLGDKAVREYDSKGKVLREIKVKFHPFGCNEIKNGNILIASEHGVYEVDKKGKVVWSLENGDIKGLNLHWITNAERLPDGNTMVCNWLGHGAKPGNIPVFTVSPDKKIVAKFDDTKKTKWVASAEIVKRKKPKRKSK